MNYYKKHWDETTGDSLTDSWGTSTYHFETDEQLNILRQIQVFQNGQVLKYDSDFIEDEFGALSDQQLDKEEFDECLIDQEEFNRTWETLKRKTI